MQRFEEFLLKKKVRRTAQRDAIVKCVFSTTKHFTAEELLEEARKIDRRVSRATVYRTLPLLVESGLLAEHDFGGPSKVYDPNVAEHPRHNHLICEDCDKIVEFEDDELDRREDRITRELGFTPAKKSVQIRANCQRLRSQGHCESRK